jgi:hypothetical protein
MAPAVGTRWNAQTTKGPRAIETRGPLLTRNNLVTIDFVNLD